MTAANLTLTLLPESHLDRRSFLVSYGLQTAFLLFILGMGFLLPNAIPWAGPATFQVTQLLDVAHVQQPIHGVKEPPRQRVPTRLFRNNGIGMDAPEPVAPNANLAPGVDLGKLLADVRSAPVVYRPAREVQTGGFGDPFGVKGVGKPGAHLLISAKGEGFDLPEGPGRGNGTGGRHGIAGIVPNTGFGGGTGMESGNSGGAGDEAAPIIVAQRMKPEPRATPVRVLWKPTPDYSEQARRLKIEGDVVLEVVFMADGTCRVVRVVRGLGYGLDESAMLAAQRIKFNPATINGAPIDYPTSARITYELAY